MNDVACYTEDQTQYAVITYGGVPAACSSAYGLYAIDYMPKTGTAFPVSTLLDAKPPVITRVEAMSQIGGNLKWLVVASMPQAGLTPAPWEVYSYDNLGGSNFLSSLYAGTTADVKSPAVAGGVGPLLSSNIGNTQFTAGYYPRDYNVGTFFHIYSQGVDVNTGAASGELQVDNNAVNYEWDVSRAYATSTSSNSGYNILSAYFDGNDILYKESPNSFVYKQGTTSVQAIDPKAITLYPNPANDRLFITRAANSSYEISNIAGKVIDKGSNKATGIDISALPSGLYIVKVREEHKAVTSLKFVKK